MARRPELTVELLPFYQAFFDLNNPGGFGGDYIGWRAVKEYCADIGLPEEAEFMFDILRTAGATVATKWGSTPTT